MADEKDPGFKVSDRRIFNADGTLREEQKPSSPAEQHSEPGTEAAGNVVSFPGESAKKKEHTQQAAPGTGRPAEAGEATRQQAAPGRAAEFPPPTFSVFINMLAVEAAMHLGLIENPMEHSAAIDLEAARHMIDALAMLQDKTRGNLTADESDMLETILAELRMQFVATSKRP